MTEIEFQICTFLMIFSLALSIYLVWKWKKELETEMNEKIERYREIILYEKETLHRRLQRDMEFKFYEFKEELNLTSPQKKASRIRKVASVPQAKKKN